MKKNGFWLSLVGLCAAAACALAIVLALVSATTALAFARQDPAAVQAKDDGAGRQRVFTGVVTDYLCGARHLASDKSAAECTRECVRKSARYALVSGDKRYLLDGNTAEVAKLAGQRAQITGLLDRNVVTVNSIAAIQ